MSSPPPAEPPPAARHDLGVLFVHGIGAQRRGETLGEFGRPILQWLEEWCAGLHDRWIGARISPERLSDLVKTLEKRETGEAGEREATTWALEAVQRLLDDAGRRFLDDIESNSPPPGDPQAAAAEEPAVRRRRLDALLAEPLQAAAERLPGAPLAAGVALTDARRETPDDPAAPSCAEVVIRRLGIDGSLDEERWLFAESWWAESFWPPRFSDLARWGLGVVPWTIGSHYGAAVRRVWAEREQVAGAGAGRRLSWAGRLALSLLRLFVSLLLGIAALLALALLLLVAALPIPRLRAALGALQRQIAASVGDSFILVTRPIEAASIVGQVRRDLEWLAQPTRCAEVAIVAHSQGAAVTHEALRGSHPGNLRLLLTLGSGLRKLEEVRNLLGRGGYLQRATRLTLGGLAVGVLYAWVLLRATASDGFAAGRNGPDAAASPLGEWLMFATYAAVGFGLVAAGLWDLVQGMDVGYLRERVRRFGSSGLRWVDCYAAKDPVPNGPLLYPPEHLAADSGEGPEFPNSVPLCNEGSASGDHTGYWRNRDEFVSLVVGELTAPPGGRQSIIAPRPVWGDAIAPRRRWRVRWLVATRWIAMLSAALAVVHGRTEWRMLLGWLSQRISGWLGAFVGAPAPGKSAPSALGVLWPTLGTLLLVLLAAGVARVSWQRWDATEMQAAIRGGRAKDYPPLFALALAGQIVLVGSLIFRVGAPWWLAAALIVGGILLVVLLFVWFAVTSPSPPSPAVSAQGRTSHAERTFMLFLKLVPFFVLLFGLLSVAAGGVRWVQRLLAEHLPPDRAPGFWLTVLLLLSAIASAIAVLVALRMGLARLRRR